MTLLKLDLAIKITLTGI